MGLLKLYDNVIACAKRKNATNDLKCLRLELERDIGGDIDKLMLYELKCESACDFDMHSFILAKVALIIAVIGVIVSTYSNKEVTTVLVVMSIIYLVILVIYAMSILFQIPKYRKIRIVLKAIKEKKTP